MVKFSVAAAFKPTTWPALLTNAAGIAERRLVDDWINPPRSFFAGQLVLGGDPPAQIRRRRSVGHRVPEPLALPMVSTGSPSATVFESPSGATGRPCAPRSWSVTTSLARS